MNLQQFFSNPIVQRCIEIFFTVLITYLAVKFINKLIDKDVTNKSIHRKFLLRILQCMIVIIAVINVGMMFETTKQLITTIIASSAFLVVILGFAAQEALSNIISGILISIFNPFNIGDRVKITDLNITGTIEDISLRHTTIRGVNNSRLLIPNSVMNKSIVENFHYEDARSGNFLDVQITFDSDINKAKEIMQNLIVNHPSVIDMRSEKEKAEGKPQVEITVRDIGDSGIWLRGTVWTASINSNFKTCSELRQAIIEEYQKEGVKLAFNTISIDKLN